MSNQQYSTDLDKNAANYSTTKPDAIGLQPTRAVVSLRPR